MEAPREVRAREIRAREIQAREIQGASALLNILLTLS
jgi:hypothetical protein